MNIYRFNLPPLPTNALVRAHAYKTAMYRKVPSVPAKLAIEKHLPKLGFTSILDWGCGRGRDVAYFKEQGLACEGHDPYFSPDIPTGPFDFATCSYVINVIASPKERKKCLTDIADLLNPDGYVLVTIRPFKQIHDIAFNYGPGILSWKRRRKHRWNKFADGYITTRGNFQAIMGMATLVSLVEECGFKIISEYNNSNFVMVLAQKV